MLLNAPFRFQQADEISCPTFAWGGYFSKTEFEPTLLQTTYEKPTISSFALFVFVGGLFVVGLEHCTRALSIYMLTAVLSFLAHEFPAALQ